MYYINALSEPAVAQMIQKKDEEPEWWMAVQLRCWSQADPRQDSSSVGGVKIDLSETSPASVRKGESAQLLEFINIIMCCDLLSTEQPRHQRHFCYSGLGLTYWRIKTEKETLLDSFNLLKDFIFISCVWMNVLPVYK